MKNPERQPNIEFNPQTLQNEVALTKQEIEEFQKLPPEEREKQRDEQLAKLKDLQIKLDQAIQEAIRTGDLDEAKKLKDNLKTDIEELESKFYIEGISLSESFSPEELNQKVVDSLKERLDDKDNVVSKGYIAYGLAGVGTPESMALRERLITKGADKDYIALGLAGVGTPESMALRERLITKGAGKDSIALGLAGVGTPESMALRERLITKGVGKDSIARGLAGVLTDESMEFRKKHFLDPTLFAKSFSSDYSFIDGVVCRYGYEE